MAKAKQKGLSLEEKLEQALIPENELPYAVPSNWVWVRLGNTVNIKRGASPRPINQFITEDENGVNWIKIGDTGEGKYVYSVKEKITPEGAKKSVKVEQGTLLLSNSMSFGRPYILNINGCIHDGWLAIAVSDVFYKEFMYYSLLASNWYFEQVAVGTAVRNLNSERVAGLPVTLPPLAEQQRIVERIESLFEKLDNAKELAQNILDTFETRKAAILHKAFTGELTAQWREKNGVGMDSWEENSVGNLFNVFSGKGFKEKEYTSEGVKLLRITNVTYNKLNWDDTKYLPVCYLEIEKNLVLQEDDIVMALNRPITNNKLKVSVIDTNESYILYQRVGCLRLKVKGDSRFYLYYMLSDKFKKQVEMQLQGSDQPYINLPPLKKIVCPVCSIHEQQEIVRILDNLLEKEEQAKELCDVIEKIELMKKAILARAFRGELGTNDPSEESAVELLKECLK